MSVKLMPQTPTIKSWLISASLQLANANIPTNRLDAEIILAFVLNVERTFLHAYPEQEIYSMQYKLANRKLKLRLKRMPIAYITGVKEFYGRKFIVNKGTLIPRPESEAIIDILKNITQNSKSNYLNLVDVGSGSGCLGITAKLELPNLNITLLDISTKALKIAKINAQKLSAEVTIIKSNLLEKYNKKPDIIIANLPYVDKNWKTSPETKYEPRLALFAEDNGQLIIKKLIDQANQYLENGGQLIIEADPDQHYSLINYARKRQLNFINKNNYILLFSKS